MAAKKSTRKRKLSPEEDAAAMMRKAVDNIREKIKAGGLPTREQLRLLEEYGLGGGKIDTRRWASTKTEAAALMGITRPTLDKVLKKPGCPPCTPAGKYDIPALKAFYQPGANVLPADTEAADAPKGSRREQLLCRKIEEELEDIRWNREVERGLWFKKVDGKEMVRRCNTRVRQELERRLLQVAPAEYAQVQGDQAECAAINRRHLEEVLRFLHTGEWKQ